MAKAGDLVRIKGGDYGFEQVVMANSGTPEAPIRFEGYDGEVLIEGPMEPKEIDLGEGRKLSRPWPTSGVGVNIQGKSHIHPGGL